MKKSLYHLSGHIVSTLSGLNIVSLRIHLIIGSENTKLVVRWLKSV